MYERKFGESSSMTQPLFSVWKGVFKTFKEAGGDLDAFDTDIWINKQKDRIYYALENYKTGNFVSKDYPLPTCSCYGSYSKRRSEYS